MTLDASGVLNRCVERSGSASSGGQKGIELQSNRARPTMAIALADKESAVDFITFSTKSSPAGPAGLCLTSRGARTSAVLTEFPRSLSPGCHLTAKSRPRRPQRQVPQWFNLELCVVRGAPLKAGAFQGTARIYGPAVADFDYAVIITQKWPWYIAAAILWYAGLLFLIAAWQT